jgi:hypothetical protein
VGRVFNVMYENDRRGKAKRNESKCTNHLLIIYQGEKKERKDDSFVQQTKNKIK